MKSRKKTSGSGGRTSGSGGRMPRRPKEPVSPGSTISSTGHSEMYDVAQIRRDRNHTQRRRKQDDRYVVNVGVSDASSSATSSYVGEYTEDDWDGNSGEDESDFSGSSSYSYDSRDYDSENYDSDSFVDADPYAVQEVDSELADVGVDHEMSYLDSNPLFGSWLDNTCGWFDRQTACLVSAPHQEASLLREAQWANQIPKIKRIESIAKNEEKRRRKHMSGSMDESQYSTSIAESQTTMDYASPAEVRSIEDPPESNLGSKSSKDLGSIKELPNAVDPPSTKNSSKPVASTESDEPHDVVALENTTETDKAVQPDTPESVERAGIDEEPMTSDKPCQSIESSNEVEESSAKEERKTTKKRRGETNENQLDIKSDSSQPPHPNDLDKGGQDLEILSKKSDASQNDEIDQHSSGPRTSPAPENTAKDSNKETQENTLPMGQSTPNFEVWGAEESANTEADVKRIEELESQDKLPNSPSSTKGESSQSGARTVEGLDTLSNKGSNVADPAAVLDPEKDKPAKEEPTGSTPLAHSSKEAEEIIVVDEKNLVVTKTDDADSMRAQKSLNVHSRPLDPEASGEGASTINKSSTSKKKKKKKTSDKETENNSIRTDNVSIAKEIMSVRSERKSSRRSKRSKNKGSASERSTRTTGSKVEPSLSGSEVASPRTALTKSIDEVDITDLTHIGSNDEVVSITSRHSRTIAIASSPRKSPRKNMKNDGDFTHQGQNLEHQEVIELSDLNKQDPWAQGADVGLSPSHRSPINIQRLSPRHERQAREEPEALSIPKLAIEDDLASRATHIWEEEEEKLTRGPSPKAIGEPTRGWTDQVHMHEADEAVSSNDGVNDRAIRGSSMWSEEEQLAKNSMAAQESVSGEMKATRRQQDSSNARNRSRSRSQSRRKKKEAARNDEGYVLDGLTGVQSLRPETKANIDRVNEERRTKSAKGRENRRQRNSTCDDVRDRQHDAHGELKESRSRDSTWQGQIGDLNHRDAYDLQAQADARPLDPPNDDFRETPQAANLEHRQRAMGVRDVTPSSSLRAEGNHVSQGDWEKQQWNTRGNQRYHTEYQEPMVSEHNRGQGLRSRDFPESRNDRIMRGPQNEASDHGIRHSRSRDRNVDGNDRESRVSRRHSRSQDVDPDGIVNTSTPQIRSMKNSDSEVMARRPRSRSRGRDARGLNSEQNDHDILKSPSREANLYKSRSRSHSREVRKRLELEKQGHEFDGNRQVSNIRPPSRGRRELASGNRDVLEPGVDSPVTRRKSKIRDLRYSNKDVQGNSIQKTRNRDLRPETTELHEPSLRKSRSRDLRESAEVGPDYGLHPSRSYDRREPNIHVIDDPGDIRQSRNDPPDYRGGHNPHVHAMQGSFNEEIGGRTSSSRHRRDVNQDLRENGGPQAMSHHIRENSDKHRVMSTSRSSRDSRTISPKDDPTRWDVQEDPIGKRDVQMRDDRDGRAREDRDERSRVRSERRSRLSDQAKDLRKLEKRLEKQLKKTGRDWDDRSQASVELRQIEKQLAKKLKRAEEKRAARLKRLRRKSEGMRFSSIRQEVGNEMQKNSIQDKVRAQVETKSITEKAQELKTVAEEPVVMRSSKPMTYSQSSRSRRVRADPRGAAPRPEDYIHG